MSIADAHLKIGDAARTRIDAPVIGRTRLSLMIAAVEGATATIVVLGSGLYLWLKRRAPRTLEDEAGVATAEALAR